MGALALPFTVICTLPVAPLSWLPPRTSVSACVAQHHLRWCSLGAHCTLHNAASYGIFRSRHGALGLRFISAGCLQKTCCHKRTCCATCLAAVCVCVRVWCTTSQSPLERHCARDSVWARGLDVCTYREHELRAAYSQGNRLPAPCTVSTVSTENRTINIHNHHVTHRKKKRTSLALLHFFLSSHPPIFDLGHACYCPCPTFHVY